MFSGKTCRCTRDIAVLLKDDWGIRKVTVGVLTLISRSLDRSKQPSVQTCSDSAETCSQF